MCSIKILDNLKDFKEILYFSDKIKLKISDIVVQEATISELKRSLKIEILTHQFGKPDRLKLFVNLENLLDKKWTFEQLNTIFSNLKASNSYEETLRQQHLIDVLEILSQYKIHPTREN